MLMRSTIPIQDQIPSGEVTADEGVVLEAGPKLVAAARVEGAAHLGRALPYECREVADRPGWVWIRVWVWVWIWVRVSALSLRPLEAAPAVDAAVRLPIVVSHLVIPILHGRLP
eukprot:scaffold97645_cov75-Phaeocystis_antarctica.AAC.1